MKLHKLNEKNKQFNVHQIDADNHNNAANIANFKLIGYPSIVLVHGDKTIPYEGPRKVEQIYQWALQQSNSDVANSLDNLDNNTENYNIQSNQELEGLLNSDKDLLLLVGHSDCIHTKNMIEDYKKVNDTLSNDKQVNVKYIDYKSYPDVKQLEEKVKIEGFPTLLLHKSNDKTYKEFNENRTVENMLTFCKAPTESEYKQEEKDHNTFDSLKVTDEELLEKLKTNKPFVLLTYADFCSHSLKAKPEFEKLRNNNKYDIVAYDYESNPDLFNKLNKYNLDIIGLPTISLFSNNTFINYNNERTTEKINDWATNILNENINNFIVKDKIQLDNIHKNKNTKLIYLTRTNTQRIDKVLSTNLINLTLNGVNLHIINNPDLFVPFRKRYHKPFTWENFVFIKDDTVNVLNLKDFNEFIISSL